MPEALVKRTLEIYPTTDLVEDALAAEPVPGRVAAAFQRRAMTLAQLEAALVQPAVRGLRRLPRGGRRLALNAILHAAADLPAFQEIARLPGFGRAVEGFLLELAASGVGPEALESAAGRLPPWLQGRALALARIGRTYANRLTERGAGDVDFLLARACQALERGAGLPGAIARYDEIHFRHIFDWPPGRIALIRALGRAFGRTGGHVFVELPACDPARQPEVAEALAPALEALEASGAEVTLIPRELRMPDPRFVTTLTAADSAGEARELAGRVASLVASGVAVHDIALAAKGMAELAPRLGEELRGVGLPCRVRQGAPLGGTVVSRLAIDLARWERPADATREQVCSIVACSAVDLRPFGGQPGESAEIVRHLRAAAIRSRASDTAGADGFISRLERLARSYDRAQRGEDAASVRHASSVVNHFFQRLDARPAHATLTRHANELRALLEDLRVTTWLSDVSRTGAGGTVSRPGAAETTQEAALALEQSAWDRLLEAIDELEDATELLGIREQIVPRSVFADWLESALAPASLRPGTTRGAAVELLELGDLAGRQFAHVFVAGAYDGRLPGPTATDPLVSEEERWLLNAAFGRPILRVAPSATARSPLPSAALLDAAALALAAESAGASLTLSRPRSDDRGRPFAASPLLSIVSAPGAPLAVPFRPLDPTLASRGSPSIALRRDVALARAAFFRGALPADPHSGDVSTLAALLQPLAAGQLKRTWSASALERLATCQFRYLAEWAWRAKEEDEPDDQAGPMEVGRLAHLAAERAVKAMLDGQLWPTDDIERALRVGLDEAARVLADAEKATVLGHPELWEITREKMLKRLRLLLELEMERTAREGVAPFGLELGFGLPGARLPAFEVAGVFVAGQVDRVDVGPRSVMVLDYKSGRTDYNATRFGEDSLFNVQVQLPLYVAALSELLPEAKGKEIDAGYVSLRDTRRTTTLREALGGATLEDIRRRLEETITNVVAYVRDGRFPVKPQSCHGCHLQPVCRIPREVA